MWNAVGLQCERQLLEDVDYIYLKWCGLDGESDEGLIDGGWWMVNGEWWCLARMYFMTRWWIEVPKLTRCCCCCYGEIEGEWPDLKRGRRRGEESWSAEMFVWGIMWVVEREKVHKEAEKVGIGNGRYLLRECVEWWLSCVIMEIVWIFGASSCNAVWLDLRFICFTCGSVIMEVKHLC